MCVLASVTKLSLVQIFSPSDPQNWCSLWVLTPKRLLPLTYDEDLIDASIFISTEYQARLAELIGSADYDVNFAEQSLTFKAADPVSFQPYLLGTESENRGTWIWSWQQLGYFPNAVVSAALQARDAGERDSVLELSTDEIPLSEGLARRLN